MWISCDQLARLRAYIPKAMLLIAVLGASYVVAQNGSASKLDNAPVGGSSALSTTTPYSTSLARDRSRDVRLSPGDLIAVRLYGVPDFSQEIRVSGSGEIALPMIGKVHAQGLTEEELEQSIALALKADGIVIDPQVSVYAKEIHAAGVLVTGEIAKPGVYPVFGGCRLVELISIAGGLTQRSGQQITITRRSNPDVPVAIRTKSTDFRDAEVFPGDSVAVPKAGVVYVLGDVGHPTGLVLEDSDSMSTIQALALAGGTGRDAGLKGTRVIRKTPSGIQEIPVPIKDILKGKTPDFTLLADDVLYVPTSRGKELLWQSASSILQAATLLSIVRP